MQLIGDLVARSDDRIFAADHGFGVVGVTARRLVRQQPNVGTASGSQLAKVVGTEHLERVLSGVRCDRDGSDDEVRLSENRRRHEMISIDLVRRALVPSIEMIRKPETQTKPTC